MTTPPLTTLWLIIIVILSSSTNCFSIFISNLTSSQPLSLNQTLVSCNHVFELGFFTPNNTSTNQYLGIWYKGHDSPRSVAWVANREHPLSLTSSTSSAVLQINNNGNLELIQHEELQNSSSTIWSTNVDLRSNRTSSSTLGLLLDNGNFVLRDVTSGENLWESFKNPCDTFFPGSVLGFNLKTGEHYKLTSWKNENDPSPGNFIFEIIKKTLPEIVISINNGSSSTIYSRSGPWNKLKFTSNGNPTIYSSYRTPFNLVENVEQGTTYLKTNDEFTNSVLFLSPNGTVMVVMKDKANYGKISYQGPSACNFYGRCGPFGACQRTESPLCKCLRGFKPKSQQEWNKGNWSGGCVRESELFCDKNDDYFELISDIRIPDMYVLVQVASNNLDTCHKWCMNNCSCIAYSFIDAVGCMVWRNTPLIDIGILESDDANDLYFRIAASSELQGYRGRQAKIIIIACVVALSSGAILLGVIAFVVHKRKAETKGNISIDNDFTRGGDDQPELHFFELDSVLIATNNFSITNKLGQGGFGSVYKGQLNGKEVAVKRLCSNSSQGDEEFRNEMILISKLQHRNLVKLIGCCIENQEKILIYEFMFNKSLDTFIFDKERRAKLDWEHRFKIIDGIARGLLYLHRDSSLRVIHRDLKASNILLDEKMNPKISDFGLARIFEDTLNQANTHRVVGTIGYMSPEYGMRGIFSEKSDVFSYGVLILEIISGKKNSSFLYGDQYESLIAYAWKLWSEDRGLELVDENLLGESYDKSQVMKCIHIGLLCVQDLASDRPSMANVASMLSNQVFDQPQPKQPIFTFQIATHDSSTKTSSRFSVNRVTLSLLEPR
ncbi:hypothetical protein CsatB_002437 [Cannabis sativa]